MDHPNPTNEPSAGRAAGKRCPNCGGDVPAGGRGLGRIYCSKVCNRRAKSRANYRGATLTPLVLAWIENRHAKPGSPEAEVCGEARRELTEVARIFLDEDEEAGRPPAGDYVRTFLLEQRSRYVDRRMK